MKPHLLKIAEKSSCYNVRHDILPAFRGIWHYHPELELHYVIKGKGVRLIGDNIANFSDGELILLGENLPHCWRCSDEYHTPGTQLNVEAIVIQFAPNCLGSYLLNLPEAYLLPKLFEKARTGMIINGPAKAEIINLMYAANEADNFDKIIILLKILNLLTKNEQYDRIALSPKGYFQTSELDNIRLSKIISYTITHFRDELYLPAVAEISNLCITSFCRYFKQMTGKSYSHFLTEIRVSHACRMLVENNLPTSMICFDAGFNNMSNFYRHFHKITGMTPHTYKMKYLKSPVRLV